MAPVDPLSAVFPDRAFADVMTGPVSGPGAMPFCPGPAMAAAGVRSCVTLPAAVVLAPEHTVRTSKVRGLAGVLRTLAHDWIRPVLVAMRHSAVDAVPIGLLSLVSLVGTVGAAVFMGHPLLLIALSARLPFLALASGQVGFWPFMAVGMVRLCIADPFHFRIGRRVGEELHTEQRPKLLAHRALVKVGVLGMVFLSPVGRNLMAAGATGQRTRSVILADLTGTCTYLVALYFLGHFLL